MNKPWDNEPTPITDTFAVEEYSPKLKLYADIHVSRNLERRMRAAERLIKIGGKWDGGYDWERWKRECNEHIEAAFKEDNT